MSGEPEWLPVAQAAQRLGLNERQVRRYAGHLPDTDRTLDRTPAGRGRILVRMSALLAVTREMRGDGHVSDMPTGHLPDASGIPAGHLPDTSDASAGHPPDSDRTEQPDETMRAEAEEETASGGALAVTIAMAMAVQRNGYERVIGAQAAQIAELQATVAHERQTSQRWQEALQREQTLRALPALPAPEEAAPDAPPAPQDGLPAAKKTFWQWLRGG